MKGGKIIRIDGEWFIAEKYSKDLVNDYRKLELLILRLFLWNSSYIDSNHALEHEWKILVKNFREECIRSEESPENTRLFFRLEKWRNMIDSIIYFRTKSIEYHRKYPESKKEKKIRLYHENRRDYWIPIRDEIHRLIENTREHNRVVNLENACHKKNEAVLPQIMWINYGPYVETPSDEDIALYLSEIESREDTRNRMIRERIEIKRAEVASAKQYADEYAERLSEAIKIEQSAKDRKRNEKLAQKEKKKKEKISEEDIFIEAENKIASLERLQ